jgi:hypothetical protein
LTSVPAASALEVLITYEHDNMDFHGTLHAMVDYLFSWMHPVKASIGGTAEWTLISQNHRMPIGDGYRSTAR